MITQEVKDRFFDLILTNNEEELKALLQQQNPEDKLELITAVTTTAYTHPNTEEAEEINVTALHIAAQQNYYNIAKILIGNGADINAISNDYISPMVINPGISEEIVDLLLINGAHISVNYEHDELFDKTQVGTMDNFLAAELLGNHLYYDDNLSLKDNVLRTIIRVNDMSVEYNGDPNPLWTISDVPMVVARLSYHFPDKEIQRLSPELEANLVGETKKRQRQEVQTGNAIAILEKHLLDNNEISEQKEEGALQESKEGGNPFNTVDHIKATSRRIGELLSNEPPNTINKFSRDFSSLNNDYLAQLSPLFNENPKRDLSWAERLVIADLQAQTKVSQEL